MLRCHCNVTSPARSPQKQLVGAEVTEAELTPHPREYCCIIIGQL